MHTITTCISQSAPIKMTWPILVTTFTLCIVERCSAFMQLNSERPWAASNHCEVTVVTSVLSVSKSAVVRARVSTGFGV